MGMFDSFYLKTKCPYCNLVTIREFQTKQFYCALDKWREGEVFTPIKIKEGVIEEVLGGCRSAKCMAWEKRYRKWTHGFGRQFYCDVLIKNYKVNRAINIRKER